MVASEVLSRKNLITPILLVATVLALLIAGFFFYQYQKTKSASRTASTQAEVKDLTNKVGRLIELPAGEDPTIATVSDKSKLVDQPFFSRSINGDKVLIYTKAKKAILYRPGTDKIIEVAPVNIGNNTQSNLPVSSPVSATSSSAAKIFTAAIYNGTTVSGLATKTKTTLESKLTNVKVLATHDAVKNDYKKTVVIDLKGGNSSEAQSIALSLNGSVGPLPEGEIKPSNIDFMIIAGQ